MNDENVSANVGSTESLQAWAQSIEREISDIVASLVPLQQRREAAVAKLELVRRLINLSNQGQDSTPDKTDSLLSGPQSASVLKIEDHIEAMLCSKGKPMHIRDIHASLIEMGVPLPGKGHEANIILRLRRDNDRFIRTERGTYALVAWNLPMYSPARRKRRIRTRKVATQ